MPRSFKHTLKLIQDCVECAEKTVITGISGHVGSLDEEEITSAFRWTLSGTLGKASDDGAFVRAIELDLSRILLGQEGVIGKYTKAIRDFSKGVYAAVSWHPRSTEKKTGGDFAFLLARPSFHAKPGTKSPHLTIVRKKQQGLLVQAKKKPWTGKWGKLSQNQKKVLSGNLSLASLLLYEYINENELQAFRWRSCKGSSLDKILGWFDRNKIPNPISSLELLQKLAEGNIGTSDPHKIDAVVLAKGSRTLVIKVDWPDDDSSFASRVKTLNSRLAKASVTGTQKQKVCAVYARD